MVGGAAQGRKAEKSGGGKMRKELTALGFGTRAIDYAFQNVEKD